MKADLGNYTRAELEDILEALGQKRSGAAAVFKALYGGSLEQLPARLRAVLGGRYSGFPPGITRKQVSKIDGTVKLLLKFHDGAPAESVVLFNDGRAAACISSQSGCACGCVFCATGAVGLRRNLAPSEIVAQFSACRREAGGSLDSVVFMGMGEPFLNWENVKKAVLILSDQKGYAFAQRRMTLSTVGIVPAIRELAGSPLKIKLAVSLITADAAQRARLVPMDKKYPLPEIMSAARYYSARTGRQVFFEYLLFEGLNDSAPAARGLLELVRGVDCKVNLILYNKAGKCAFSPSGVEKARAFQEILIKAGLRAHLRREKGADISAACGQLAAGAN